MGKDKIAGQVAHAAVQAAESLRRYCPDWYYSWLEDDSLETKIILKVVLNAAMVIVKTINCPDWYYSWLEDDSLETKIILKVVLNAAMVIVKTINFVLVIIYE